MADNITISEALTCRNESIYMNCESGLFTDCLLYTSDVYKRQRLISSMVRQPSSMHSSILSLVRSSQRQRIVAVSYTHLVKRS